MAAEIVGDGVDPLGLGRQPALHRFQEGHPVPGAAARVGSGESGAGGGAEGTEDVALATSAIVDLLSGPARGRRLRPHQVSAWVTLGAERAHLVQTDDYAALRRRSVERL